MYWICSTQPLRRFKTATQIGEGSMSTFKFKHRSSSLFSPPPPLFSAVRHLPRDFFLPTWAKYGRGRYLHTVVTASYIMLRHRPPPTPLRRQNASTLAEPRCIIFPNLVHCEFSELAMSHVTDHCSSHDTVVTQCHPLILLTISPSPPSMVGSLGIEDELAKYAISDSAGMASLSAHSTCGSNSLINAAPSHTPQWVYRGIRVLSVLTVLLTHQAPTLIITNSAGCK
jgi:hypothetical protein